ncbi:MAG: C25 family cysteine peptidase [Anaerolineae bacterium]
MKHDQPGRLSNPFFTSLLVLCFATAWFTVSTIPASAAPASAAPAPVEPRLIQSDTSRIVVEMQFPAYTASQTTANGETYTLLSLPGLGTTGEAGKPQLPIKGIMAGIPPGAQATVKILADEARTLTLDHPPVPAPREEVQFKFDQVLPTGDRTVIEPDRAAYASNQLYPAQAAILRETGDWRSQHYAALEFHPLQYNAATRQLVFHQRVRVELTLTYPRGKTAAELGGVQNEGPFEKILQKTLVNYDTAKQWRSARPAALAQVASAPKYSGAPWYRIAVNADGMYTVTCAQLAQAAGVSLSIDPTTLQVYKQGSEMAILVGGASWNNCTTGDTGDVVQFYGQAITSKYANNNIYWLTYGHATGKRMAAEDGSGAGTVATNFTTNTHLEQNLMYRAQVPLTGETDRWYWTYVAPVYGVPSWTTTVQIPYLASGTFTATLQVTAGAFSTNGHHTQLFVNGNQVDDETWQGSMVWKGTAQFPQSYLHTGSNTIQLTELTDQDTNDFLFVDSADLSYQASFTTANNLLRFGQDNANATLEYQVNGFTTGDAQAYDISDPFNTSQFISTSVTPNGGAYTLQFADTYSGTHQYVALTPASLAQPVTVTQASLVNLHDTGNAADEIIISYGGFISDVQPLATYRAGQGLRVKVVDVQNVYDEFSDGVVDPQAIRDFLAYAYAHWQAPAPSFALLVGQGTFDPKEYCLSNVSCQRATPAGMEYIPAVLHAVDAQIGETANDDWLVMFSGTKLPDMALGRLPGTTTAEVDGMVNKILNFEQNPPAGSWRTNVSFVTGNSYLEDGTADTAGNFWNLSDEIANSSFYLPAPFTATRVYYNPCDPSQYPQCQLPYVSYSTNTAEEAAINAAINNGSLIVSYTGHAASQSWGGNSSVAGSYQLFNMTDVAALTNGNKTPVLLEMTCFTGYYINPGGHSLAETNILRSGNGAVASWAATGWGVATGHRMLATGFFKAVMQQGITQIGSATVYGKANLWLNSGGSFQDLLDTYLLFGDPASRLPMTATDVTIGQKVNPASQGVMGNPITYLLTVTNTGAGLAEKVTISDTLPATLLNPAFYLNGAPISPNSTAPFTWTVGSLSPGASAAISVTGAMDPDPSHYSGAAVSNTATVTTATPETNSGNNSSNTTVNMIAQSDVTINKTATVSSPVVMGDPVGYVLTFTNNGPTSAQNVVITDTLAAVLSSPSFISSGAPVTQTGGAPYSWQAGTLAPGATGVITVSATTDPNPADYGSLTLNNKATLATTTAQTNTANDVSSANLTMIAPADVIMNQAAIPPAQVVMGDPITYVLTFTNTGPRAAANVVVTDTLAAVLSSPSFISSGVPVTQTGGAPYSWQVGTLAPGATGVITISATTDSNPPDYAGPTIDNTATIATTTAQTNTANDASSTHVTALLPVADVAISQTLNPPAQAAMGDPVTIVLSFRNNGPRPATGVLMTDTLPALLLYPTYTASGAPVTRTGTTPFTWQAGTLAPNDSGVITITGTLDPNRLHYGSLTFSNTASISTTAAQANTANDTATNLLSILTRFFIDLPFIVH